MALWGAYSLTLAKCGRGFIRRFIFLILPLPLLLFDPRVLGLVGGLAAIGLGQAIKSKWASDKRVDLLFLLLAALVAYLFGFRIEFITNPRGGFFYLASLSLPLTLLWVVAVSGALSFLHDERLLARVGFIVCASFLLILLLQEPAVPFAVTLTLMTLGALTAMRLGSIKPSTVSRELGFVIALISIAGVLKAPASLAILTPVLMLGVPVMTTSFSIAYGRAFENPLIAFFTKRGYSQSAAIFLIYLVMSCLSLSLVLLTKFPNAYALALALGAVGLVVFWRKDRLLQGGFGEDAQRVHLFGTPVNRLNLAQTVDKLEEFIACRRTRVVCTPDTTALMRAQRDERLRAVYERADLVTADGAGLVWASKFLGAPLPERVAGIDLVYELCRRKRGSKPYKLFLLGARKGVAEEAAARLAREFSVKVVGTHHGYFGDAENERIIQKINISRPDALLAGMGVPKQEFWILEHKTRLNVPLIMGVGGSFDVISGRIKRAPKVWQRAGLEWAYRILIEPRRIFRARLILAFILRVLLLKFLISFESRPCVSKLRRRGSA